MEQRKISAWQVLRNRFPENEYVLISEVPDAMGFSKGRSMDFMIINLWPSRGLSVTGIERKSNRGDWLKELKTPQKQENHFKYCDYFFLLTDEEGVAKIEEIPETWGWYHINEKGVLKTIKDAPKLSPQPIAKGLMCAMLRRAAAKEKYVHVDILEEHIQAKAESIRQDRNRELTQKASDYDTLKKIINDFENASGINLLHSWGDVSKKTGEAVRIIMNGDLAHYTNSLERIESQVKKIYEGISTKVKSIKELDILNSEAPARNDN